MVVGLLPSGLYFEGLELIGNGILMKTRMGPSRLG